MKIKSQLLLASALVLTALLVSCSQPRQWNEQQRVEFVTSIDDYRDMLYLSELSDPEFSIFATDLSGNIEVAYPVYTKFIAMPAVSDTIDMWVVTTIVDELESDASNMRYLYPYRTLVAEGILPEGLNHASRQAFYRCLAQKVNQHFSSIESFFYAAITNTLDQNIITTMQTECATDLLML